MTERRMSKRVPVDLEIDCRCEDVFLFTYILDISALGIFVRANNPHPPGTLLTLRFALPDKQGEPVVTEGEVLWTGALKTAANGKEVPGMGIRFTNLDEDIRSRLSHMLD